GVLQWPLWPCCAPACPRIQSHTGGPSRSRSPHRSCLRHHTARRAGGGPDRSQCTQGCQQKCSHKGPSKIRVKPVARVWEEYAEAIQWRNGGGSPGKLRMRPPVQSDEQDNTTMERLALCFILWPKDLTRSPRGTILCDHI